MSRFLGSLMGMAAGLSFIVAILFLIAFLLSGFGLTPLVYAVLWALAGITLMRGWRWMAYFAFLLALAGGVAAFYSMGSQSLLLSWLYTFLALDQLCIIALLFLQIWRR